MSAATLAVGRWPVLWSKYVAFARFAAAEAAVERRALCGQIAFLTVILGIFAGLWRAVAESGMPLPATPGALVWYVAVTEWICMSAPLVHTEMEQEIRSGDVAYQTTRPVSYVARWLAQAVGRLAFRVPAFAASAAGAAWLFAGDAPPDASWSVVAIAGVIGVLLLSVLHVQVGLLAFWLPDIAPIYWVAQKLLFVLGGLLLPLPIYPEWARQLAMLTPFPWALWGPASQVFASGRLDFVTLVAGLTVWTAGALAVAAWTYRRALRRLQVNGG